MNPAHPHERDEREGAPRLDERVLDLIEAGRQPAARRDLARNWREATPELPLRFPIVVTAFSQRGMGRLLASIRRGEKPENLRLGVSRRRIAVYIGALKLGELPRADSDFLYGLGEDRDLYRISLRAIRFDTQGRPEALEAELVREEWNVCTYCGSLHNEPHLNCTSCRKSRRRVDRERARIEAPPIGLHEALDALAEADQRSERSRAEP
jgi:hypothetical protein